MRSKGFITATIAGGRIAGTDGQPGLTYFPAHTVNGKAFNQRVTFTVYVNSNKGTKRDGTPGRSDRFHIVVYGPLADSICRCMSNGKAIDAILRPHIYEGRLFDKSGAMRLEADGSPIIVEKVGFQIVDSPIYGEDSLKTIELEVATGRRPINWNVTNHPDSATWTQMLKDRSNVQYVPGSTTFGYARVIVPQGQGTVVTAQVATGPLAKAAAQAARASNTTVNAPPASAQQEPTVAVTQSQLALMIAQATSGQGAGLPTPTPTPTPVATQGIDSKTGFPLASTDTTAVGTNVAF